MTAVFQRPFPPLSEKTQRLKSAFFIAFFVFGFLYVFEPFGLAELEDRLSVITALYGLITFGTLIISQLLVPVLFKSYYLEQKWTVGKEIIQSMGNVLLIAIGNFLLSCYLGFFPWSIHTFFLFVGFTLAIGIIPVTVQILIRQNIYHRRNAKAVVDDNQAIAKREESVDSSLVVHISRSDGEEAFQAKANEILAIESSGNYIEVHRSDGRPVLIRKSLNATERVLPKEFFRTHRSWIVNLARVSHVDGNARGYILRFENAPFEVPVSRSKLNDFDLKLKALSKS